MVVHCIMQALFVKTCGTGRKSETVQRVQLRKCPFGQATTWQRESLGLVELGTTGTGQCEDR